MSRSSLLLLWVLLGVACSAPNASEMTSEMTPEMDASESVRDLSPESVEVFWPSAQWDTYLFGVQDQEVTLATSGVYLYLIAQHQKIVVLNLETGEPVSYIQWLGDLDTNVRSGTISHVGLRGLDGVIAGETESGAPGITERTLTVMGGEFGEPIIVFQPTQKILNMDLTGPMISVVTQDEFGHSLHQKVPRSADAFSLTFQTTPWPSANAPELLRSTPSNYLWWEAGTLRHWAPGSPDSPAILHQQPSSPATFLARESAVAWSQDQEVVLGAVTPEGSWREAARVEATDLVALDPEGHVLVETSQGISWASPTGESTPLWEASQRPAAMTLGRDHIYWVRDRQVLRQHMQTP